MTRWWVHRCDDGAAPRLVHRMPASWAPHVKSSARPSVRLTFDSERDLNVFMRAYTTVGFVENAPQGALFRRS